MDFSAYPNLCFHLECGRIIKVNAFVWEPSYLERIEINSESTQKRVRIERRQGVYEHLFGACPVHRVNAKFVDRYINDPPRLPNSVITVSLSSAPLSVGAIYSELVVELYLDYVEGLNMEAILEKYLYDLDWEDLANDVDYESTLIQPDCVVENSKPH